MENRPAAIILCGGRSRRMGRSKALLPFGPEAMLQGVVRIVSEVARPVVVVAAPGQELPALPPSVDIVRDPVADRGPLQGIAAGLAALPESVEFAYVSATDTPFVDPGWILRLIDLIGSDDLAIPEVGGYFHPLSALYRRRTVLPAVEGLLRADRLRPTSLLETLRFRILVAGDMGGAEAAARILRNLNTIDDYRAALAEAGFDPEIAGALDLGPAGGLESREGPGGMVRPAPEGG